MVSKGMPNQALHLTRRECRLLGAHGSPHLPGRLMETRARTAPRQPAVAG